MCAESTFIAIIFHVGLGIQHVVIIMLYCEHSAFIGSCQWGHNPKSEWPIMWVKGFCALSLSLASPTKRSLLPHYPGFPNYHYSKMMFCYRRGLQPGDSLHFCLILTWHIQSLVVLSKMKCSLCVHRPLQMIETMTKEVGNPENTCMVKVIIILMPD